MHTSSSSGKGEQSSCPARHVQENFSAFSIWPLYVLSDQSACARGRGRRCLPESGGRRRQRRDCSRIGGIWARFRDWSASHCEAVCRIARSSRSYERLLTHGRGAALLRDPKQPEQRSHCARHGAPSPCSARTHSRHKCPRILSLMRMLRGWRQVEMPPALLQPPRHPLPLTVRRETAL